MVNALSPRYMTDLMDIYRVVSALDGNITKLSRVLIAKAVPCRVYISERTDEKMEETAARVQYANKLTCANTVDVQAGDELVLARGANLPIPVIRAQQTFFAGVPVYYDQRLPHQEISIYREARVS